MYATAIYDPNKKYDEATVYRAIKSAFSDFRTIARANAATHWARMSRTEKYNTGRGLAFMADIARDPARYFARAHTVNLWDFPINSLTVSPATIVLNRINGYNILPEKFKYHFSKMCEMAQNWEYDRKSSYDIVRRNTNLYAHFITQKAYNIGRAAQIASRPRIIQPILRFMQNLRQY